MNGFTVRIQPALDTILRCLLHRLTCLVVPSLEAHHRDVGEGILLRWMIHVIEIHREDDGELIRQRNVADSGLQVAAWVRLEAHLRDLGTRHVLGGLLEEGRLKADEVVGEEVLCLLAGGRSSCPLLRCKNGQRA